MNCARVQEQLLLYLAGELTLEQKEAVARHLERCAPCAALAEGLSETGERVAAALPPIGEAPAALDARVMEAVRRLPAPRRPWQTLLPRRGLRQRLALTAAAACLLLAGFGTGDWYGVHRRPALTGMAAALDLTVLGDAHRQTLGEAPSAEIRASVPRQLSQALAPLLPFRVAVVDLQPEGIQLVGGSRAIVQGVPVAVLHYQWKGERISVFQVDAGKLPLPDLRQVVRKGDSYYAARTDGITYVAWPLGRTNCVMVARAVPMHRLFQFACHASERLERT